MPCRKEAAVKRSLPSPGGGARVNFLRLDELVLVATGVAAVRIGLVLGLSAGAGALAGEGVAEYTRDLVGSGA